MRRLGHAVRMNADRIPKVLLYGELVQGKCPTDRPKLHHKDICKRDLKALSIGLNTWGAVASTRLAWKQRVQKDLSEIEKMLTQQSEAKRLRRKAQSQSDRPVSDFTCAQCGRDCHTSIGLSSHTRRCARVTVPERNSIISRE